MIDVVVETREYSDWAKKWVAREVAFSCLLGQGRNLKLCSFMNKVAGSA